MPDWFFVIIIVGMALGLGAMGIVFDYFKHQNKAKVTGGPSLTSRELQDMMRQAVEEGTLPLVSRVEAIEQQLNEQHKRLNATGFNAFDPYASEEEARKKANISV